MTTPTYRGISPRERPLTCEHCPNIEPPEFIVGDEYHEEYWCNRCTHNLRLTTNEMNRPPIRLIEPEWSNNGEEGRKR